MASPINNPSILVELQVMAPAETKQSLPFNRRTLLLSSAAPRPPLPTPKPKVAPPPKLPSLPIGPSAQPCNALVINASHEQAKEISLQLTLQMPACSIMYAPSIETARWILGRRHIDIIISNQILPDGSIAKLRDALERMQSPAELIVIGASTAKSMAMLNDSPYHCSTLRKIQSPDVNEATHAKARSTPQAKADTSIRTLGADIRNDLNNPLQEIVAMVFVAKASGQASASSVCALDAIEKAAKNMAKIVNGLEDKIRSNLAAP
ncbi:MAG: hypothetical protein K1X79_00760 [Oligoflexia bacterium]|nr:hypothetical protein [Oligoflexia bacterium]